MRQVVRGRTIKELEKNIKHRERAGWKCITDHKLDDSNADYGDIQWVCVMEMPGRDIKRKWGYMNGN